MSNDTLSQCHAETIDESGNESDKNNILPTPLRGNDDQNDDDHNILMDKLSQKKVCNMSFTSK
jgi:hypothetical protein